MCEHFVARAAEPFALAELWPFVERLERFGIAGFGWGAAWLASDPTDAGTGSSLRSHRQTLAFRDDPATSTLATEETTAVLVHLRRPSRLSTLHLPDAQPFDDPAGRFAFSHNGELETWRERRAAYEKEGRIRGRADTEVAARWLEDAWDVATPAGQLLCRVHETFGGDANLAVLTADGRPTAYAGNPENPVFIFRLGRIGVASTGIYSIDRSLFRFVAQGATERQLVRPGRSVELAGNGGAVDASRAREPLMPGRASR